MTDSKLIKKVFKDYGFRIMEDIDYDFYAGVESFENGEAYIASFAINNAPHNVFTTDYFSCDVIIDAKGVNFIGWEAGDDDNESKEYYINTPSFKDSILVLDSIKKLSKAFIVACFQKR
jgi:hypothetical protein